MWFGLQSDLLHSLTTKKSFFLSMQASLAKLAFCTIPIVCHQFHEKCLWQYLRIMELPSKPTSWKETFKCEHVEKVRWFSCPVCRLINLLTRRTKRFLLSIASSSNQMEKQVNHHVIRQCKSLKLTALEKSSVCFLLC